MIEQIRERVAQKSVLILGFGREGKSTLKMLIEAGSCSSITIADAREVTKEEACGYSTVCGEGYLDCLDDYDLVFKSPGIVLGKEINEYKCEITSQVDEFIKVYKANIIGITGTKGKSTTSSFVAKMFEVAGYDVVLAGNIGLPVFEVAKRIHKDTICVIELSCHQLEYAKTSPKYGILLNIFEDHLDHYGTREKYAAAKMNLYRNMISTDYLWVNPDNMPADGECKGTVTEVNIEECPYDSLENLENVSLRGEHNRYNTTFVYLLGRHFGISEECFMKALQEFQPLPHRLSYVGCKNGVQYYDDSISTTVKSAISAVESIMNASVILLGGMERDIDYTELVEYLAASNRIKYAVCMYDSGKRIYEMLNARLENPHDGNVTPIYAENLCKAVERAKELSKPGEAVVLSPAAASYGYFKNFEERGDVFADIAMKD